MIWDERINKTPKRAHKFPEAKNEILKIDLDKMVIKYPQD